MMIVRGRKIRENKQKRMNPFFLGLSLRGRVLGDQIPGPI